MLEFDDDGHPVLNDDGSPRNSRPRKRSPYAAMDIQDTSGKAIVKAYEKIDKEAARKIEALGLDSLDIVYINNYIVATLDQEGTAVYSKETALIDIYRKIRPGDPATPESARSLINSIFFDSRRYDLAKVGRHKDEQEAEAVASAQYSQHHERRRDRDHALCRHAFARRRHRG